MLYNKKYIHFFLFRYIEIFKNVYKIHSYQSTTEKEN